MRITSKGQVTIPIEYRKTLGFSPLTEIEFIVDGKGLRIRKSKKDRDRIRSGIQKAMGTANTGMTTEQILSLTRG